MEAGTSPLSAPHRERLRRLFAAQVDTSGDCWPWIGYCDPKGYGRFTLEAEDAVLLGLNIRRQVAKAPRVALALAGVPLDGLMALHGCDNPPCVRVHPDHVYAGTASQNMLDRAERNPQSFLRGEANPTAVLTDVQRVEIRVRRAHGETLRSLGAAYGVSHTAIRKVCRP